MPIDINNTANFKNDITINYNYNNIPLYVNQFENTIQNGGFIKIPYVSNGAEPTIVIVDEKNQSVQYKTTKLHIVKSQGIVSDISYVAEFIIEHKSTTNNNTLYTTVLLNSDVNISRTNVDEIIQYSQNNGKNSPSNINISLQNVIDNNKEGKTIYYTDNNTTIIVLTTPFLIQNVFDASFLSLVPPVFNASPSSYKIIEPIQGFTTGFMERFHIQEGLTQSVYCQPVEMTDPSGGDVTAEAELSIPLVGKYGSNDATNNVARTAVNFMSFMMVLGLTYILSPVIYTNYIIGLIEKSGQEKMNRIRSIDVYMCAIFIMVTFGLISQGINDNNPGATVMGFFVGLFFIISFVIIQKEKIIGTWLRDTFNEPEESTINEYYTNISMADDFLKFVWENVSFVFFSLNIFIFLIIYGLFLLFLGVLGSFKKGGLMSSGNGFFYLLFIAMYMTIVLMSITNTNK